MFQHNPANKYDYWKRHVNLDITHRCMLQCSRCMRTLAGKSVYKRGSDLKVSNFNKICKSFDSILFCGQMGDPIYHPQFHDLLDTAIENNVHLSVATNGHGKKDTWWDISFEKMNKLNHKWTFGLDGLPEESCLHRINQDGEDVWRQMLRAVSAGNIVEWQYIIFKYNEDNIKKASKMAKDNGMLFLLVESSRWLSDNDPLKPSKYFIERIIV